MRGRAGGILLFVLCLLAAVASRGQSFTLAINDTKDSVQWQSSSDHVTWTDIPGGNVRTYVAYPTQTTYYRARIESVGCLPLYSDTKSAILYGDSLMGGKLISGQITLPAGSAVPLTSLTVTSFLGATKVAADGTFQVVVLDTASSAVLLVTNGSGRVTMLGHFIGPQQKYTIDAQSSASALLSLYPFLLPVDTGTEKQLLAQYLVQPEFPGLLSAVGSIVASGAPLLSPDNSAVVSAVLAIMGKSYNASRVASDRTTHGWPSSGIAGANRLAHRGLPFGSLPITIESEGSVMTVSNAAFCSYSGGLYKANNGDTTLLQSFMVDGKFDEQNPILSLCVSYINDLLILNGNSSPTAEQRFDLSQYSKTPGTYLFRLRDGLAYDNTLEDVNGGLENATLLCGSFIGDELQGALEALTKTKDKCFFAFLSQLVKTTSTTMGAKPNSNFYTDILIPDVTAYAEAAETCNSSPFLQFFSPLMQITELFKNTVTLELPTPAFEAAWILARPTTDGCNLLDRNNKAYTCFSFSPTTNTQFDATTCDVITLGFQATGSPQFYPYTGEVVAGVPFTWTTTQGDGIFAPDDASTVNAVTDENGNATIQFVVPQTAAANTVAAIDNMNETKPSAIVFYNAPATSPTYTATASSATDNQSGQSGSVLAKALVINFTDQNGSLIDPSKFNVTWNTNGNGSVTEVDEQLGSYTIPTWLWTLGPIPGQQQIEATVESANCGWEIQGNPVVFTATAYGPVQLTTNPPTAIGQDTAVSGGDITSDGGSPITKSGVCWGIGQTPDTTGPHSTDGTAAGSFSSIIRGLASKQPYFVRAYAVNATGVYYGSQVGFTTLAFTPPTLTTAVVTGITATGGMGGGTVTADGGEPVTAAGVCWGTASGPTIGSPGTHTDDATGLGAFSSSLTGLTPSTTYYVRAYATNSVGTAYGAEVSFTTAVAGPTVTTELLGYSITDTTTYVVGSITGGNLADVLARGVCWSTSPTTTVSDNALTAATSASSYEVLVSLLQPATTYYASAYITTAAGVVYGNVVTFTTTPATAPFVTDIPVSNIGATSAQSGGTITSDGASPVTARGVCWSTAQNPTISGSKTSDGTGAGGFLSTMTGLTVGTTYYIRPYATNAIGTTYGTQMTFVARPDSLTVITAPVTEITGASAICGGTVTSTSVYALMTRGVCWSTTSDPTTTVSYNSYNTAAGSFVRVVSPLQPSTTYYIRAYAADSSGNITYGNLETFTTGPTNPYTNFTGTFFADSACQVGGCIFQTQDIYITFQLDLSDPTLSGIWTDPYGTGIWPMTGTLSDLVTDYDDGNGYRPAHYFIEHRYELKGTLVGNTYSGTIISYQTYKVQEIDGTIDTTYGQQKGTFSVTKQ